MKNLYKILDLNEQATKDQIKKRYHHRAKKYHPDTGNVKDSEKFREVQTAYEILSDPEKRARYDAGEDPDVINNQESEESTIKDTIMGLFASALQNCSDAAHTNLIEEMKKNIDALVEANETQIKQDTRTLDRVKEIKERLSGEDNLLMDIVDNQIEIGEAQLVKLNKLTEVLKKSHTKLKKYSYRSDLRENDFRGFGAALSYRASALIDRSAYDSFNSY